MANELLKGINSMVEESKAEPTPKTEHWNKKLSKGDMVEVEDKNGKLNKSYIGGFYKDQKLQDNDTYETHDFTPLEHVSLKRALNILKGNK